jgi:hypothetical protein
MPHSIIYACQGPTVVLPSARGTLDSEPDRPVRGGLPSAGEGLTWTAWRIAQEVRGPSVMGRVMSGLRDLNRDFECGGARMEARF